MSLIDFKNLINFKKRLAVHREESQKRAAELIVARKELAFHNKEKEKRAAELLAATKEIIFQNKEKAKRAAELAVANKELVFQTEEKGKRAAELVVANKELVFQAEEKEKRAAELIIAEAELVYQNGEMRKREAELVSANAAHKKDEVYIRYLAAIVESSGDAIVSKSMDGIIQTWNNGGEKMFGYTSNEAVGTHISLIIPTEYINEEKEIVERIRKNETIAHYETVRLKKNGERFYVSLTVSPLKDRAGNIIGISKIARDISSRRESEMALVNANKELVFQSKEREKKTTKLIVANAELVFQDVEKEKRAAELNIANKELAFQNEEKEKRAAELSFVNNELKKAKEKFRLVVESTPSAMILVDNAGFITLVNNQTENLFGYDRNELIGNRLELLLPQQPCKQHAVNEHRFFEKPRRRLMRDDERDIFALKKNGSEIQVEAGLSPVETENGYMVLVSITDVTERKIQEASQIKHIKDLAQFAYVASHDLQEPLRTVSNYMQVFEEDYLPLLDENARKYLHSVNDATKRMSMLVKSLLEFSRLGHNKKLSFVDCRTVVNNVIADLDSMIKTSNVIIEMTDLPCLMIYETEMRQVFQNLIINAIKFRRKDIQPQIKIRSERTSEAWKFSVKDNGIGIDSSHFERVFGIFQRLHTQEEYEGSGIGLANCKKIIQLHQGEIWIESTLGQGTTFYFTIPALTL
jgi:PAS domain S-box-containing protein